MARVNIVKRIKINGRWVMRSIPRKQSGNWDWNSLPDGRYYVEWYEQGSRRREPAAPHTAITEKHVRPAKGIQRTKKSA